MLSIVTYDCEIEKGILGRGETPEPGIEYCKVVDHLTTGPGESAA